MEFRFEVDESDEKERLDVILTEYLGEEQLVSRAQILNWIDQSLVQINGERAAKGSYRVRSGDVLVVRIPEARSLLLEPQADVQYGVVFEDEDILVVDKPAGLVVHPGAGVYRGTLVNGLLHHLGSSLQRIGDAIRPGIIHRLDKDTSGLLVVAKSELAFVKLREQLLPPRLMKRHYICLVEQVPKKGSGSIHLHEGLSGTIDLPIGRHVKDRKKMAVRVSGGKEARTNWRVIETYPRAILIEAELETGRTHQIRVHFAASGAPLLGDPLYGRPVTGLRPSIQSLMKQFKRQALHAVKLSFLHPRTGERVEFTSPPAEDLQRLLHALKG